MVNHVPTPPPLMSVVVIVDVDVDDDVKGEKNRSTRSVSRSKYNTGWYHNARRLANKGQQKQKVLVSDSSAAAAVDPANN